MFNIVMFIASKLHVLGQTIYSPKQSNWYEHIVPSTSLKRIPFE